MLKGVEKTYSFLAQLFKSGSTLALSVKDASHFRELNLVRSSAREQPERAAGEEDENSDDDEKMNREEPAGESRGAVSLKRTKKN